MDRIPRAIVMTMVIVAVVMAGLGIALAAVAPRDGIGFVFWTLALTLGGIIVIGGLAFWLFRKIAGGANADLLKMIGGAGGRPVHAGLPGSATVLSVRDTGITINHINAMMDVGLRVQARDQTAYETKTRVTLPRHRWGALQPGMTVAVRIDPKDRHRVAIDLTGGADHSRRGGVFRPSVSVEPSETFHAPGGTFQVPGLGANAQTSGVVSTADILRNGVRGVAEIQSVSQTGATAAQMVPGRDMPEDQADDPMILIALRVHPRHDPPFDAKAVMRVPDGKLQHLSIGKRVPVAWPEDRPDSVTIDWPNLR